MTARRGIVYGLGVGPGDPELLTLRAHRLLTSVPVVFAPAGRNGRPGLARRIVDGYLDPSRQRIEALSFALARDHAAMEAAWATAADRVAAVSAEGLDAAFVTEGDPLTYSTFAHLARTLRQRHPEVPVEAIPGVTSFAAASALALQPLVDQDELLAVIPATYVLDDLEETLRRFDTVVLLKVAGVFDRIFDLLERLDLVESALFVERAGWPEQRLTWDVRGLRGLPLDYFSLLIVYTRQGDRHA